MTLDLQSASSSFSVNVTINSNQYNLQYLGCWGGPWESEPTDVPANSSKTFTLNDNNRGGIWYRAIDPSKQEEAGFVTMSFTCPELSDNSAEGSSGEGQFISAGLQTYDGSGHPLNIEYKVGTSNLACWDSGSSNNHSITCPQTNFADSRLSITVVNAGYKLQFKGYWNDNDSKASNWYWEPNAKDTPPCGCKRTVFLKDNDRAGLFYGAYDVTGTSQLGFSCLSFTNPKLSGVSAEGSPSASNKLVSAGLQNYTEHGTGPFKIEYKIGEPNLACWNSGSSNDNTTTCKQTTLSDERAFITIKNNTPEKLNFNGYWNDNGGGKSNWYFEPDASDTIPPTGSRMLVLKDNDRAGIYYTQAWMEFHMSFTCPKMSSNSAEGSPHTGLQTYNESGTPLELVYNVGTPNLACWSSGSSNNGRVVCKQTLVLPFDLRRWMGKLNEKFPNQFQNKTLREMYIPGSHDTACYLADMTPWGQTQQSGFYRQLISGVRYMDLRPCYSSQQSHPDDPPTPANRFHHGPLITSCMLGTLLGDIVRFYTEDWNNRQNEIIILDFSHFDRYSSNDQFKFFFDEILNSDISQYLIPQGSFGSNTSLKSLWTASSKQRVIASVSQDAYIAYQTISSTSKPNIWNGASLFAQGWDGTRFWPDKNKEQDLIDFINNNIATFSSYSNLWVLQAILTPTLTQSVYSLSGQASDALYGTNGLSWRSRTNIVIQDYYDERTTIEAIMENIKRM